MLKYIGLLMIIPILDLILLIVLVPYLGWKLVVVLVVLTALLGLLLVRLEGRHTLRKMQRKLASGDPPTDEVIDGALLIAAGAFLLTPGLATDLLGFLFVIPVTRFPIRWSLKRWVIVPYVDKQTGGFVSGNVYVGGFPPSRHPEEDATGAGAGAGAGPGSTVEGGNGGNGGENDGSESDVDIGNLDGATDVDYEEVEDSERTEE